MAGFSREQESVLAAFRNLCGAMGTGKPEAVRKVAGAEFLETIRGLSEKKDFGAELKALGASWAKAKINDVAYSEDFAMWRVSWGVKGIKESGVWFKGSGDSFTAQNFSPAK